MFWENYVELCNKEKKSPNTVARELEISSGSVTGWKQGRIPNTPILKKIADHFNVSVDSLMTTLDYDPFDVDIKNINNETKVSRTAGTWRQTNIKVQQTNAENKEITYIVKYELQTDDKNTINFIAEFIPADHDGYSHLAYLYNFANKKELPLEVQYTITYGKYNYRLKYKSNGITLYATIKPKNATATDIMATIEEHLRNNNQL